MHLLTRLVIMDQYFATYINMMFYYSYKLMGKIIINNSISEDSDSNQSSLIYLKNKMHFVG